MEIKAATVMEAWREAIRLILAEGRIFTDDESRESCELLNLTVTIESPSTAVEAVRAMRAYRKWIYPSEEELANIVLNKDALPNYDYLYGQRIFDYDHTLNQVDEYVIPLLQQRPNTRRAVVTLLNPLRDARIGKKNFPSISVISFRVIEQRLCVTVFIRTSGFFTGWPANVYQMSKLQEYVAHALALPRGPLTTISLSAHLHMDTLDDVEAVLGKGVAKRK